MHKISSKYMDFNEYRTLREKKRNLTKKNSKRCGLIELCCGNLKPFTVYVALETLVRKKSRLNFI